ncbi:hypothetical protein GGI20_001531 [Coemansia sp. BCRC 34301]|nr:hypothetical protein GGI20_001531 [Coemansia sp. BCRC 34301]
MALSGGVYSMAAVSANNGVGGNPPQQTRYTAYSLALNIVKANLATPSVHDSAPQSSSESHRNNIVRTTTIEEPFSLAPRATSTPASTNSPEKSAMGSDTYAQSSQPQPSYLFDIVGDEVSVVLLSGSSVVSKWREPPTHGPTFAVGRHIQTPSARMSADLSSLARQQNGYITIATSPESAHTSPALPATHTFQDTPWDGPALLSSTPHPLTLTPDIQSSFTAKASVLSTHKAGSSNSNNKSGSAKDPGLTRLSDGYIVLISVAALFVLATLFYFYARYFKHRKAISSSNGPSHPGSHASQPASPDISVNRKNHASLNQGNRNLPDSGTGINFQEKPTDAAGGKLEVNAMSINQPPSALFRSPSRGHYNMYRHADLDKQDCMADGALKDRYINYRYPGATAVERGISIAQQGHAATRQNIPSFQDSDANRPRELPTQAAASDHSMNSLGQFEMPPPQTWPRPVAAQTSTNTQSVSCSDFKDRSALLDTSSANPSLNSKACNSPGARIKTRKLVRDSTKRTSSNTPAKLKHKSPASFTNISKLDNQDASPATAEAKIVEQSKSNHSMTLLRTKLWSAAHLPKNDKEAVANEAIEARPSAFETTHSAHDGLDKLSPLMESIESFSESYQFAIRHKPPLGPLRVVEAHAPALTDELSIEKGHHMFVIGEFADGWVLAINASRNNECGMVPRRCLFLPTAPFMTKEAINASISTCGTKNVVPHAEL